MEGWLKAELSEGKEAVIPVIGESTVLYCCPRDRRKAWESDIGSLDIQNGEIIWNSAFGIDSGFDGMKFERVLEYYEVCFTAAPPLEAGRFPSPLGIAVNGVFEPAQTI